jgi:hypothetical protein
LRNKIGSANDMKKEEGSKERYLFEKWKGKCDCYERRKRIKRMMVNWEIKWEILMLWKKKKDQKNNDQLRNEMEDADVMREEEGTKERWSIEKWNGNFEWCEKRRTIKRTTNNWEMKCELLLLWEKKKDPKNDNQLGSEMENDNLMRGKEETKEQ